MLPSTDFRRGRSPRAARAQAPAPETDREHTTTAKSSGSNRASAGGLHALPRGASPRALLVARLSTGSPTAVLEGQGSGGLPANVTEFAAPLGRPSRVAGTVAVDRASTKWEPAATGQASPHARQPSSRRPRADCRRREPVYAAAGRPVLRLGVRISTVPTTPRWHLAIPDAISQIKQLHRPEPPALAYAGARAASKPGSAPPATRISADYRCSKQPAPWRRTTNCPVGRWSGCPGGASPESTTDPCRLASRDELAQLWGTQG